MNELNKVFNGLLQGIVALLDESSVPHKSINDQVKRDLLEMLILSEMRKRIICLLIKEWATVTELIVSHVFEWLSGSKFCRQF